MASERGITDNVVQLLFNGNNLLDILYILYSRSNTRRAAAASLALGKNKLNYLYSPFFQRNFVQQQLIKYIYNYLTKIVKEETFWATYSNTVRAIRKIVDENYFRDPNDSFLQDPYNLNLTANVAYQDEPYNKTTTVTMVEGRIYGSFKSGGVFTGDFVTRRNYYNLYDPTGVASVSLNLDYKPPTVFDLTEFVKPKNTVRKVAAFGQKKYIVGAYFDPVIMAAATDVTVTEGEDTDYAEEIQEMLDSGTITEDEADYLLAEYEEEVAGDDELAEYEEEVAGDDELELLAADPSESSQERAERKRINRQRLREYFERQAEKTSGEAVYVYTFRYNAKKAEQIVNKLNNRVNKKTFGLLLKTDEGKQQITAGGLYSINNQDEGQYNLPVFTFQNLTDSFKNFQQQGITSFNYPNLYTYF